MTHPTPQYHQRYENSLFALLRESYGATQNAMLGESKKNFFIRQKYFFIIAGQNIFLIYLIYILLYIIIYIIFFLIFFTKERNGLSLILFFTLWLSS
ncbi:MAG: hypothetical protein [Cotesia congregata filamentous virus 2]